MGKQIKDKPPICLEDMKRFISGQDDFRLEIAVLRMFKKRGLQVSHGGTYEDPVKKTARQFDIRGSVRRKNLSVHLAVECKNLRADNPLLISTLPRSQGESYHEVVYSHDAIIENGYRLDGVGSEAIRLKSHLSMYPVNAHCGKSTTQVGKDSKGDFVSGDGEVYEKWSQAIASAHDLVNDSRTDNNRLNVRIAFSVVIPVLVLSDGMLWEARYAESGEVIGDPVQVESSEVYIGKSIWTGPKGVDYTFSHLHVFTVSGFEAYLDQLTTSDGFWTTGFPEDKMNRMIHSGEFEC